MSDGFDDLDLLDANAAGPGLLVPGIFGPATFAPHPSAFFGLRVSGRPSPTMATAVDGGCPGCDRAF